MAYAGLTCRTFHTKIHPIPLYFQIYSHRGVSPRPFRASGPRGEPLHTKSEDFHV